MFNYWDDASELSLACRDHKSYTKIEVRDCPIRWLLKGLNANTDQLIPSTLIGILDVWNSVLAERQWSDSGNAPVFYSRTVSDAFAPLAKPAALPQYVKI